MSRLFQWCLAILILVPFVLGDAPVAAQTSVGASSYQSTSPAPLLKPVGSGHNSLLLWCLTPEIILRQVCRSFALFGAYSFHDRQENQNRVFSSPSPEEPK